MRHPRARRALLSASLLLPIAVRAISLDCGHLREDGVSFNFQDLEGPHSVFDIKDVSVGYANTTYTIDICNKLERPKGVDKNHFCPDGTRICAVREHVDGDSSLIDAVVPIARGNELADGARLEPEYKRLKDSESNEDSKKEGLRVILHGGKNKDDGNKKQRAIIDFLCRRDNKKSERHVRRDGEKHGDEKDDKSKADDDKKEKDGDKKGGDDDNKHADWEKLRRSDDGKGGELEFLSYHTTEEYGTLRMNWYTKYACENSTGDDNGGSSAPRGGWGFFSWFFLLLLLGIIAYFGFFAWVNYSKYGAHGWDLLPHSDTIRDIPYIMADWGRKVVSTFTGGPSRGGYSAV